MDWPIEYPERQATIGNARVSSLNDNVDMGRLLAGAIVDGNREVVAYILGAGRGELQAVAEAALNLMEERQRPD